jgi:8-oxo-dGTP pyrophosphatase MutT (NUDIX family)
MRNRIRAAALIHNDNRLLLVRHVHPVTCFDWWVPPGGGLEPGDRSIFHCAAREVLEETGLTVELSRVVYLGEYLDRENQAHNIELFLLATAFQGGLTIRGIQGNGPDEHFIQDVRWIGRDELQSLVVFPTILKDVFWADLESGFPETRYLGVHGD